MMVYDNVTKRNMRFAALMSDEERLALCGAVTFAIETLQNFEARTSDDDAMLAGFRTLETKLRNPVVKPREGEK